MEEKTYINKYIRIPVWLFMLFVNTFLFLSSIKVILWLIPIAVTKGTENFNPVFLDWLKGVGIALLFIMLKSGLMSNGVYLRNPETKKGTHISWDEYRAIRESNVREFWTKMKELDDALERYRERLDENDEEEYEDNLEKAMGKIESIK